MCPRTSLGARIASRSTAGGSTSGGARAVAGSAAATTPRTGMRRLMRPTPGTLSSAHSSRTRTGSGATWTRSPSCFPSRAIPSGLTLKGAWLDRTDARRSLITWLSGPRNRVPSRATPHRAAVPFRVSTTSSSFGTGRSTLPTRSTFGGPYLSYTTARISLSGVPLNGDQEAEERKVSASAGSAPANSPCLDRKTLHSGFVLSPVSPVVDQLSKHLFVHRATPFMVRTTLPIFCPVST